MLLSSAVYIYVYCKVYTIIHSVHTTNASSDVSFEFLFLNRVSNVFFYLFASFSHYLFIIFPRMSDRYTNILYI